jgi:hypothetical protein
MVQMTRFVICNHPRKHANPEEIELPKNTREIMTQINADEH